MFEMNQNLNLEKMKINNSLKREEVIFLFFIIIMIK